MPCRAERKERGGVQSVSPAASAYPRRVVHVPVRAHAGGDGGRGEDGWRRADSGSVRTDRDASSSGAHAARDVLPPTTGHAAPAVGPPRGGFDAFSLRNGIMLLFITLLKPYERNAA